MTHNAAESDIGLSYFNPYRPSLMLFQKKKPAQMAIYQDHLRRLFHLCPRTLPHPVSHNPQAQSAQYWNIMRTLAIVLECLIFQVPYS